MATTTLTTTIHCIECQRPWLVQSERWLIKLLDEPVPEVVPYCPDCHAREFGDS